MSNYCICWKEKVDGYLPELGRHFISRGTTASRHGTIILSQAQFGILDECTNATSVDVEEHLYRIASNLGITVMTSSQRPALIPFHSVELRLIDGEGKWELRTIEQ
ncbi:UNVERIFIED_CONTAM: ABC transporter D family member 1 [Sesamum calycinum]|uniref:ABC transporter D family member 1 n=1 Tax=Sesamum calycinum TaxID=2727403 RepID=A0AAW2SVB2_9LAMI